MRDIFDGIHELDELLSDDLPEEDADFAPEPEPAPDPVGFVTRKLEGPDGSIIEVEVPVYAASDGTAPDLEPDPDGEAGDPGADEEGVELTDLSELLEREDAD